MERFIKAQDLLSMFERGLNPLPEVEQDAALLIRLGSANQTRLEAYFKLYAIRVDRQELRLFSDGSDRVYVLTWPGPLFKSHWEQRLVTKPTRRKRNQ
jgi:hypothetical protein